MRDHSLRPLRPRAASALVLATLGLLLGLAAPGAAATLRVPTDRSSIQDALDAAVPGDTVRVASGTYSDLVEREVGGVLFRAVAVLPGGVHLVSDDGAEATILDGGDPGGDDAFSPVVVGVVTSGTQTLLRGFTIRGGAVGSAGLHVVEGDAATRLDVKECVFDGLDGGGGDGGGIRSLGAVLEIEESEFLACAADRGGGLYFRGAEPEHEATIRGCHFEECEGGGLEVAFGNAFVEDSFFVRNIGPRGGGITSARGELLASGCWFEENESTLYGGGAVFLPTVSGAGRGDFERNVFVRNRTTSATRGGGAVFLHRRHGGFLNNTFVGNETASNPGSALYANTASALVERNVFASSRGGEAVALVATGGSRGCNLYWDNTVGDVAGFSLAPTDRVADPLFCDPEADAYGLSPGSPCAPEGSPPSCGLIGARGLECEALAPVLVASSPAGMTLQVDGSSEIAPIFRDWSPGSLHHLAAPVDQVGPAGKLYVFDSWSDGGDIVHSVRIPAEPVVYTAAFTEKPATTFRVRTSPAGLEFAVDGVVHQDVVTISTFEGRPHRLSSVSPQPADWPEAVYRYSRWSDGGDSSHTILAPPGTHEYVVYYELGADHGAMLNSEPVGLVLLVDGEERTTPVFEDWLPGSVHQIEAVTPQEKSSWSVWAFREWSSTADTSLTITMPTDPIARTAYYESETKITTRLRTSPSGIPLLLDGQAISTPSYVRSGRGKVHTIEAPALYDNEPGSAWRWQSWSDGGSRVHEFVVPAENWILQADYLGAVFSGTHIETNVPGTVLHVDGAPIEPPVFMEWAEGTEHTLRAQALQIIGTTAYRFVAWEDGSTDSVRTWTQPVRQATLRAEFTATEHPITIVTTDPISIPVIVDGETHDAPAVFEWPTGTVHTLEVDSLSTPSGGERHVFASWSDGQPRVHSIEVGTASTTYTAVFDPAYLVETSALPVGLVEPPPGWYAGGDTLEFRATAPPRYRFTEWSGTYPGSENPFTVVLDRPIAQTAHFVTNGVEIALSLSDSDPDVSTGAPAGIRSVHLWLLCAGPEGITGLSGAATATMPLYAFQPAAGVIDAGVFPEIDLGLTPCDSGPRRLGAFVVDDTGGGTMCLEPGSTGELVATGCPGRDELSYSWPEFLSIRGIATDGAEPCSSGTGCSSSEAALESVSTETSEAEAMSPSPPPEAAAAPLALPTSLVLATPSPNPFRNATRLHFELPQAARVDLSVFDVAGRRVACVLSGDRSAGRYDVAWEARDARGRSLPAGVYFLRLDVGGDALVRKIVLLRGN